jgi:hypothetical protein
VDRDNGGEGRDREGCHKLEILKFISRHAFMRLLISNRESQLTSKVVRAALETLNVQHNLAAV